MALGCKQKSVVVGVGGLFLGGVLGGLLVSDEDESGVAVCFSELPPAAAAFRARAGFRLGAFYFLLHLSTTKPLITRTSSLLITLLEQL